VIKKTISVLCTVALLANWLVSPPTKAAAPAAFEVLRVGFESQGEADQYFSGGGLVSSAAAAPDEVIAGDGSLVLEVAEGSSYVQALNLKAGYLEADTKYTVVFKYKPLVTYETPKTMYMLALGQDNLHPIQFEDRTHVRWTNVDGNNYDFYDNGQYCLARYTFTTDSAADRDVRLFIDAGGKIAIDDFAIYKGDYTPPIDTMNISPMYTEDFDKVATDRFALAQGQAAYVNDGTQLNGTGSLRGGAGAAWSFAETDPARLTLAANTRYTVTFKYKGTAPLQPGEFYHVTLWSDTGGFDVHRYIRWIDDGIIAEGSLLPYHPHFVDADGIGYAKITFETGNFPDYKLQFGVNSAVSQLYIDDVRIFAGAGYTSEPAIAGGTPSAQYTERFEAGDIEASLFYPEAGRLLNSGEELINGHYSFGATTPDGSPWVRILNSRADKLVFSPDTNYTLTMRMKPPAVNGADGFYQISIDNADFSGSAYLRFDHAGALIESSRVTNYAVRDQGDYWELTATFKLANHADYRFNVYIHNGGSLVLDDIRLFEGVYGSPDIPAAPEEQTVAPIYTERFETRDFESWLFYPDWGGVSDKIPNIINGSFSFASKPPATTWQSTLFSRTDRIKLKPDQNYTVAFRYATMQPSAPDGFFMLVVKSPTGGIAHDKYVNFSDTGIRLDGNAMFSAANRGDYYDAVVSFKTDSFDDYYINFYTNTAGQLLVDDIRLFEGLFGNADIPVEVNEQPPAPPPYIPPPVERANPALAPVIAESFEALNVRDTLFNIESGTYVYGDAQINGKFSLQLKGRSAEWNDLLKSNGKLRFDGDKTYTIVLKIKNAVLQGEGGFFQIALATDEGTYLKDKYVRFDAAGFKTEGNDVYFHSEPQGDYRLTAVTFKLDAFADYQLRATMFGQGEMTIDDVEIYLGEQYNDSIAASKQAYTPAILFGEGFEGEKTSYLLDDGEMKRNKADVISGGQAYRIKNSNAEWTSSLKSNWDIVRLKPENTYTVAFKYKPVGVSGLDSFVQISMNTVEGGYLMDKFARFTAEGQYVDGNANDFKIVKAGGYNVVYASFTLERYSDYQVVFSIYKDSSIIVDDIAVVQGLIHLPPQYVVPVMPLTVEPEPGEAQPQEPAETAIPIIKSAPLWAERFESEQAAKWLFEGKNGEVVFKRPDVVNGSYSYKIKASQEEWTTGLLSRSAVKLKPNRIYTATFNIKESKSAGADGFYMFSVKTDTGTYLNDLYLRFDGSGKPLDGNVLFSRTTQLQDDVTQIAVVFETRTFDDYQLALTVYKQGELILDDIRLFDGFGYAEDAALAIADKAATVIAVEDFERSSSLFHHTSGQLTWKLPDILNGSRSYRFKALGEWTEGLLSKQDQLQFEPGGVYTITFKYRSLAPTGENGVYQVAFKAANGDYLLDKFVRFNAEGQFVSGNVIAFNHHREGDMQLVSLTAALENYDDYLLSFVIGTAGELLLDDIVITQGYVYDVDFASSVVETQIVDASLVGYGDFQYELPALRGILNYGALLAYGPATRAADVIVENNFRRVLSPAPEEIAGNNNDFNWQLVSGMAVAVILAGAAVVVIRKNKLKKMTK